jgi:hypothetical protein
VVDMVGTALVRSLESGVGKPMLRGTLEGLAQ